MVDAIVEVTETGSTIKANKLKIIHELMRTNPQLICNHAALDDQWKKEKIEQTRALLIGQLLAINKVGLKLNVHTDKLTGVVKLLPSLNAPTVLALSDNKWYAVKMVVDVTVVRDLIPKLLLSGAEGIIEYSLNKVI